MVNLRYPDPNTALLNIRVLLNEAYDAIRDLLHEPTQTKCIFAPLIGMELSTYNRRMHHPDDLRSQPLLNDTVTLVNTEIVKFNTVNNVSTPWISKIIHKRNRNSVTHQYHKLMADGCHLSQTVLNHWADSIHDAILKNS